MKEYRRADLDHLYSSLEQDRTSFLSHWREIADNVAPRRPRFYTTDVNRGDRRNSNIVDTSPVLSARALRAGMMSGITSPARPWFRLTVPNNDAMMDRNDTGPVKDWLDDTTERMNSVFSRSNLYNTLLNVYGDIGNFATSAMLLEEDDEYVIRCYSIPIGSYVIGLSEKLKVEVFGRKFTMTVRQIILKFGGGGKTIDWSNISLAVRDKYEAGHLNHPVDVIHMITPNEYFDESKIESKYKRFRSSYFEASKSANQYDLSDDLFLRESGYDYFPVLVPRWETTGEDAWGTNCPGMEALGDCKQLQLGQRKLAQAIDLMVRPPMKGSTALASTSASILPGKITYVDERGDQGGFKPVFQVDPKVQELERLQAEVRQRISRTFFEDLFLMMSQSDRREITAREIDERHEEKLLALGPVLEQLNQDLLDPLIEVTFGFMLNRGLIAEPPANIQGAAVKVEYISIMAQAQKLAGLASIDRFMQFVGTVAAYDQTVLSKVDTHNIADWYADITSMRSGVVRTDEAVAKINEAQAAQVAAQQKAQNALAATQGAKNLSETDMSGDNALSRIIQAGQAGSLLSSTGTAN